MDNAALQNFVNRRWDESIVPTLMDYIRIPNKSPAFDPEWQGRGLIDQVVERFHQWALHHPLSAMKIDIVRLYGRGAADDGYAMFAGLSAIAALQAQSVAHARCVMLIEACEESGSFDLPHIIEHLGDLIGNPSLVIALDSGCGNY